MTSDATSIRRLSFRLAVENPSFAIRDVIDMATSDGDVLVRRWAFALALKTTPEDWGHLRERASFDCYWPIRRIAYESLEAEPSCMLNPSSASSSMLLQASDANVKVS
jgi:hypothetical protein